MTQKDEQRLAGLVPVPSRDANKYTRGRLVVVGGSSSYPGAAAMCSHAAQLSGAGYVQAYVEDNACDVVRLACGPSLVVRPWSVWDAGRAPASKAGHPVAFAVGSGLDGGQARDAALAQGALSVTAPLLLDGGALRAVADEGHARACRDRAARGLATVLTPHAGEAAALAKGAGLLGSAEEDPAAFAAALAKAYGAVVALKGPVTHVSDGMRAYRMDEGTPALAKAGTGDVLAGVVGALLAQGLDAFDAAVLGTTVHARAGRAAEESLGTVSVRPEDVIECLPEVFKGLLIERREPHEEG